MATWARGVGESFELPLFFLLGGFCGANLIELGNGGGDTARFAKDAYF